MNTGMQNGKAIRALSAILVAVLIVVAYIAVSYVTGAVAGSIIRAGRPDADRAEFDALAAEYSSLSILVSNVIAAALVTAVILILKRKIPETLGLRKASPWLIFLCIPLGAAFNVFSSTLFALIPFPESLIKVYESAYSFIGNGSAAVEIVSAVIVTPIVEEIVFRGLAYKIMKRETGAALAVILSSLLFGAAHMNVISFIFTFALGIILALCFEKSGSLICPILIHAAFNAASFLWMLLAPVILLKGIFVITAATSGVICAALTVCFFAASKNRKENTPSPEDPAKIGE